MSKQVGSMRRKGSGYELRVSTNRKDAKGNYIYKTKMAHGTERQVKKVLAQFVTEVMEGKHNAENIKFKAFADERLQAWKHNLKFTTLGGYQLMLEKHLYPVFGKYDMKKITPIMIQRYYNDARENGRKDGRNKPLSSTTIQRHHQLIHKLFADALKWNYVNLNPADLVDKPKKDKPEISFLTIEEMNEFTESMSISTWGELAYVACWTGMRMGELLGLKWGDINLDQEFISVQRSLIFDTKTKQSFYEKPKTKTSIRRIDIDVDLKHYLRSMKENQLSIFNEVDDDSPVFRYLDGKPFNNQSVSQGIKKGLQKMGRGDCSMHSLRHSHASALLSADAPLKVVSERLGHASIAITADTYSHVAPSIQKHHINNLAILRNSEIAPEIHSDNITKLVVND
tara:strand:+ start:99 stop:1292 length:1194 start_codon:yes stop_codon:yes gene_type:complete